jgi:hypothetical protein
MYGRKRFDMELDTYYCKMATSPLMNESIRRFSHRELHIDLKPQCDVVAARPYHHSSKIQNRHKREEIA